MAKINTYTTAGTRGSVAFPKALEEKMNKSLLAQAIRVYQDRSHPGLSKVKTRSEVDLTTAKVWRQKGTGRARHGARSAPIFVGGGAAHGPKGVKRRLKLSRNIARKSLLIALSQKVKKGRVLIVKGISKLKKTKDTQKLIDVIVKKEKLNEKVNISLVISKEDNEIKRAFRNIRNVQILIFENLNTLDIFLGGLIVFEGKAFEKFTKAKTPSKETDRKKGNTEYTEVAKSTEKTKKTNRKTSKGTKRVRKAKKKTSKDAKNSKKSKSSTSKSKVNRKG
jgi:large subunit ribosomal protein L4